jgi:hypothetical protein
MENMFLSQLKHKEDESRKRSDDVLAGATSDRGFKKYSFNLPGIDKIKE